MESAITAKGQATIPKEVRDYLHVQPGDRIKFFFHPDGHVVMLPKVPTAKLRGMLRGYVDKTLSVEEMDDAIGAELTEKYMRS